MNNSIWAILGIIGGVLCAAADLFLDLKGPDNKKMGRLKVIDSKWEDMPHWRFVTSTVLAFFAIPLYSCGFVALSNKLSENSTVYGRIFLIAGLIGAMSGLLIHSFLNICPTVYQIVKKEASFETAEKAINASFKQIYVPFFVGYVSLVFVTSGMAVYAIISGMISAPLWCVVLNPVVFQIIGLLFRATKLKCFIDAPSCCAASLGLASFGLLALLIV